MPGSASSIRAGRAYYELFTKNNPLVKGLQAAENLVRGSISKVSKSVTEAVGNAGKSLKSTLSSPITAMAAALAPLAAGKLFAGMSEELTDISRRTGASTDALQTLGYAAKRTGSDLAGVESMLTALRDKTMEAARGSEDAQLAFARLGLNFLALSRMKPEDRLRHVAEALNNIPNPAIRAAAAADLLGSADFLPTLQQMQALEARAKRLGLVLGSDTVAAGKQLSNSLHDLYDNLAATVGLLAGKVAPVITQLIEKWIQMSAHTRKWIADNTAMFSSVDTLWAFLKLKWAEGSEFLKEKWQDAQLKMVELAAALVDAVPAAWETIKGAAAPAIAFIEQQWASATEKIQTAWINATAEIEAGWITVTHVAESAIKNLEKAFDTAKDAMLAPFNAAIEACRLLGFKLDDLEKQMKNFAKGHGVILGANLKQFAGLNDPQLDLKLARNDQRRRNKLADLKPGQAPDIKGKLDALDPIVAGAADFLNKHLEPLIKKMDRPPDNAKEKAEIERLRQEYEQKLKDAAANKERPEEAEDRGFGGGGHQAGLDQAVMHVQGLGAVDVRSKEGFASVAASLRQQQVQQQQLSLQQQQYIVERDTRDFLKQLIVVGQK